jgi:hypothetical protein
MIISQYSFVKNEIYNEPPHLQSILLMSMHDMRRLLVFTIIETKKRLCAAYPVDAHAQDTRVN